MKFLVDEHIPLMTVQALTMMGHDVLDIRGTPDEGMQDDALWEMAQREERLLITTDSWSREIETFDRGCIAYGGDLCSIVAPLGRRHRRTADERIAAMT